MTKPKKSFLLLFIIALLLPSLVLAQEKDKEKVKLEVEVLSKEEALVPVELSMWDLKVENQTFTSVTITWETSKDADQCVWYGYTKDNLEFSVCPAGMTTNHSVFIDNLLMGTVYYFKAGSKDAQGNKVEQGPFTFTTLLVQIEIPEVTDLMSKFTVPGLLITWKNPQINDFGGVIVVKKQNDCPAGIFDGRVIYRGNGNAILDKDLEYGQMYCYRVFVYNFSGNVSRGVKTGLLSITYWRYAGLVIISNWWLILLAIVFLIIAIYDARKKFYVYMLTDAGNEFLKLGVTRNLKREAKLHGDKVFKIDGNSVILTKLVYFKHYLGGGKAGKEAKMINKMSYGERVNYIKRENPNLEDLSGKIP